MKQSGSSHKNMQKQKTEELGSQNFNIEEQLRKT